MYHGPSSSSYITTTSLYNNFAHLTMFSCIYMVIDCDYVVVMVSDSEDDQWIVSVNIVSVSKKT